MSDIKLNYRGDRRNYDPNHLVGPDLGYAFLKPVHAEYDAAQDITSITFHTLLQDKLPKAAILFGGKCLAAQQQRLLFLARAGDPQAMADLKAGKGHFAR